MAAVRIPAHEIRWIVDRYHVGVPEDEVRAELERRASAAGATPSEARRVGKSAVRMHQENRDLYARVTSGRLR